eukprot:TRINITY_DN1933_c0_g1_i1.p1 TRINITY_DN1933_c0_g1~~TRINITY_DN1933_c0_g1_i1.p1  ORF type:complete len:111 (-),score=6.46 TRINITY_DN1933_c0_g1_i1:98-430(-)
MTKTARRKDGDPGVEGCQPPLTTIALIKHIRKKKKKSHSCVAKNTTERSIQVTERTGLSKYYAFLMTLCSKYRPEQGKRELKWLAVLAQTYTRKVKKAMQTNTRNVAQKE